MGHVAGIIAVEDVLSSDDRIIRQHGLTWQTPIPVFMQTTLETRPIGQLDVIERCGQHIAGYGSVLEGYPVLPCGVGLTDVDVEATAELAVIKSGRIIEVTVYFATDAHAAWPGCALINHVRPVCTTCRRTRDDRVGQFCSNSFHLGRPL